MVNCECDEYMVNTNYTIYFITGLQRLFSWGWEGEFDLPWIEDEPMDDSVREAAKYSSSTSGQATKANPPPPPGEHSGHF